MAAIEPIVELGLRSAPFRVHSPMWRLAVVASGAGAAGIALLMSFLLVVLAATADDRGVIYVVSSLCVLLGALCLIASGGFALDAIQTKNQVQSGLADRFDAGSIWVGARVFIQALLFGALAVAGFRIAKNAKSSRPAADRAAVKPGPIVVRTPVRAPTPPAPR